MRPEGPHVWDCIIYNGEAPLIDLRLGIYVASSTHGGLSDWWDRYHLVVVEGTTTFQGRPKPVVFDRQFEGLALRMADDHLHHVVVDLPDPGGIIGGAGTEHYMVRENHQRAAIAQGFAGADPDDLVIVGDADEFVKPWAIEFAEAYTRNELAAIIEPMAETYVWTPRLWYPGMWRCSTIARAAVADPVAMRAARANGSVEIPWGTWHYTWQGGPAYCWSKIQAFSHPEVMTRSVSPHTGEPIAPITGPDVLAAFIDARTDIWGVPLQERPLDWRHPFAVQRGALDSEVWQRFVPR